MAEKQEAIGNFASTRHIDRVRRKLIQLADRYGRIGRDGIRIDFPVSHTVLGEMVGSSRETVTRAVDELQRTGFVARRGHTYRLLVPPERLGALPPACEDADEQRSTRQRVPRVPVDPDEHLDLAGLHTPREL